MSEAAEKPPLPNGRTYSNKLTTGRNPRYPNFIMGGPGPPTRGRKGGNGSWKKKNGKAAASKIEAAGQTHESLTDLSVVSLSLLNPEPSDTTLEAKFKRMEVALVALQEFGTIRAACRVANITRNTYFKWIDQHPEFKLAAELALADQVDDLEEEVYRRAKEKSDALLMFALKAHRPQFREAQPEKPDDPTDAAQKRAVAQEAVRSKLQSLMERRALNSGLDGKSTSKDDVEEEGVVIPKERPPKAKKKGW